MGMPAWAGSPLNAVAVGGSLTAVTLMVLLIVLLASVPSVTWKTTVRDAVVGSSDVFVYFTLRSAVW